MDRTNCLHSATVVVVVNKLNRDLFGQAVALLIDPDRKRPDDNMRWLNPGLVGRVRYLFGQQRASPCHRHELLAGRRVSLMADRHGGDIC